ncbi:MAG TPA: chemotaxis protein CheW [Gemmatimonadales bacterium]
MTLRQPRAAGPVDWAALRRRVEAAGAAIGGGAAPSPEQARQLLEDRARALARAPDPVRTGDTIELVTFAVADEVYGIESAYVLEVFRLVDLSPLPGAEPPVSGLTTWRGELLAILDLRRVLGLPTTPLHDLNRVVVLGAERAAFGLLADEVRGLVSRPAAEVRALPEGIAADREYLRGITDDAILVLQANTLLELQR